jgi:hypothetical protein
MSEGIAETKIIIAAMPVTILGWPIIVEFAKSNGIPTPVRRMPIIPQIRQVRAAGFTELGGM